MIVAIRGKPYPPRSPQFRYIGDRRRQYATTSRQLVVVDHMIRSGETLADGGTTQAEVAIVGAGPVGLAVAIRLAGCADRIVLIEAGGMRFRAVDNLVPPPTDDLEIVKSLSQSLKASCRLFARFGLDFMLFGKRRNYELPRTRIARRHATV